MPRSLFAVAPFSVLVPFLAALLSTPAAGQEGAACEAWLPTFGEIPGTNLEVRALATFDDGTGPALYAGGDFSTAGGVAANGVAKWDGLAWSPLGSGVAGFAPHNNAFVNALAVFDDGTGPALFAAGNFQYAGGVPAKQVAKWNGAGWSALGSGLNQPVNALAVFDDGSGPALYAGGYFETAGDVVAWRIAKWDGSSWSAVGLGGVPHGYVKTLAVVDDGRRPALYAGGDFTIAGGVLATNIAKWDGTSWSALGAGTDGPVNSLAGFDGPAGPALYAGGDFTTAGGVAASCIAKWNGTSWSHLGSGVSGGNLFTNVLALTVFDDGGGPALFAGGDFTSAGDIAANSIARWDGSWSALGSGLESGLKAHEAVGALARFDGGGGAVLVAGGTFTSAGGSGANQVAAWDGAGWSSLGGPSVSAPVHALVTFDDGGGPALYTGGEFTSVGGVPANRIARWDGTSWSALGSGLDGWPVEFSPTKVSCLAVFDDGTGPALYAGGHFLTAGGVSTGTIARWDGASWSSLGGGMNRPVEDLAVFDDGTGPALYAVGDFNLPLPGGGFAESIAKWDGATWSALGSGLEGGDGHALAVFDDGGGPALYAGGSFESAGGVSGTWRIAKWDGSSWSSIGPGFWVDPSFGTARVSDLIVFDDGSGPALFAGGLFTWPTNGIIKWDGSSWSALAGGVSGDETTFSAPWVRALAVLGEGGGVLYAGGHFGQAGGVPASKIARWDGSSWSALGSGMDDVVFSLGVFDDGVGPALYAGGQFTMSPAGDGYLARWGCPAIESLPGCAGNPATLAALATGAPLGTPLDLQLTGFDALSGLAVVFYGQPGFDAGGCGFLLPGYGELLLALAPPPLLAASAALAGGASSLSVPVPATPGLLGVTAHLQGAAVDASLAAPVELTNALALKLGP